MIAHDLQVIDAWLGKAWPNGVIGVGGCGADNEPFSRVLNYDGRTPLTDALWLILNEAMAQLAAYECGNGRSVWFFEGAILQIVSRSDGAWAGVFTAREVSQAVQGGIDTRMREFLSMVD